ncbi:MAG: chloride channel protein [Deltaproteobacteria bacterium]|nr:chloride channel protein [Deltaproteobacteria bacterium]
MASEPPPPRPVPRPRFFVALLLVACGAALFASAFRVGVEAVFERVFHAPNVLAAFERLPLWARVAIPAVGGLLAGLASERARRLQGGQGVGDVMEAVALGGREVSLPATAWKAAGSFGAIVSGGSIGREGPIILFGGALGSRLGAALRISAIRTRALIAAGTAAGFAAAYNTPFAAVLFVVEVVTGVVALGIVLPTLIAAAIATAITRFVVGPGPIYGQHAFAMRSDGELLIHLLLGVAAGLVGVAFVRMLGAGERAFARLPVARPLRPAIGGAIVGVIACALPTVTGNGYEAIALILAGKVGVALLAILVIAKAIATTSSVGSGSPGGVFTPSLFLGAALGAMVASALARFWPALPVGPAGGYALVGMAAVVAATTHAPLMSAVLVFELSGDYAIVLPLLVATSAATAVARELMPSSIYMQELERKGVRWKVTLDGRVVERNEE